MKYRYSFSDPASVLLWRDDGGREERVMRSDRGGDRMEPWCDEYELALTNRHDFRHEGTPVHGAALEDVRLVLRAAWHGAMHAFDDVERKRIIDAMERVERAL